MRNRSFAQMKRAKKRGLSNTDLLRMKELAKKESRAAYDDMRKEAVEKEFFMMLTIPLNVLVHDYWPKSAKKKVPEFMKEVLSLYDSFQNGTVSFEELAAVLKEYAGMDVVDADWSNVKDGRAYVER